MAKYLYNKKTSKLHIENFCHCAKSKVGMEIFDSEDDVIAKYGRTVSICKKCEKQKEKIINEVKN